MDETRSAFLSRLKLRHLRLLVALSETRSLRRASEYMAMTQPSCSVLLSELEALAGAPLCTRHARGLQLNALGQIAAQMARSMLHEARKLQEEFSQYATGIMGSVHLGAIVASIGDVVAPSMRALTASHPRITTHLVTDTSDRLLQRLHAGELDIVIGRQIEAVIDPTLDCAGPRSEPLAVIARRGHIVARKRALTLHDLAGLQWVLQTAPSPMRRAIDTMFIASGISIPRCKIETASTYATLKIVESSEMCAIVPKSVAQSFSDWSGITSLDITLPDLLGNYHVITIKNRTLSPAATLIRAHLSEAVIA